MKLKLNPWELLAPFSVLFAAGSALRNYMFDNGLRTIERTDAKVISVGGIMAGGSGKTPVTLDVVRWLVYKLIPLDDWEEGRYPVAIISRGYGRKSNGVRVVCDGENLLCTPEDGGDEPVMMAKKLLSDPRRTVFGTTRGVPVIVAENRAEGVLEAERLFGVKVAVLDDAFSHRLIARDLDILLINEDLPSWWWRPLPAGRMRESLNSIRRADFFVFKGARENQILRDKLLDLNDGQMKFAMTWVESDTCWILGGQKDGHQGTLMNKKVLLATGIARPERFFNSVDDRFVTVLDTISQRDHVPWNLAQRTRVLDRARELGADAIVLTAKDAVKWPNEEYDPQVLVQDVVLRWSPERKREQFATLDPPPPAANPELLEMLHAVWESVEK
jgi:tetraacyldisaccharide 4'-kinase